MTGAPQEYRLYRELARWWPLISPMPEYAQDAACLSQVFREAAVPVREVLDLGSGGGHVAAHLKHGLRLTLVDLSPQMLAVSRRLNPECEHVEGDMRTVRLGRMFGGVLVHDAVDYVTTRPDLRLVIETAFAHCQPGGLAVFAPDYTAETFTPASGGGGSSDAAGRHGSFRERTWDPDPADEWIQADYEFMLQEPGAQPQVIRESHRLGAFRRHTWLTLLSGAGFRAQAKDTGGPHNASRRGGVLFIGYRPRGLPGTACVAAPQAPARGCPGPRNVSSNVADAGRRAGWPLRSGHTGDTRVKDPGTGNAARSRRRHAR
jgi:SAM-dependent methyltransferase